MRARVVVLSAPLSVTVTAPVFVAVMSIAGSSTLL